VIRIENLVQKGQCIATGNFGHPRHRTKTNKTQKYKWWATSGGEHIRWWTRVLVEG